MARRRSTTDLYKVNNSAMLVPDNEVGENYEDVDAAETGRDETGHMKRYPVFYKCGKWSFDYNLITKEDYMFMEALFPDDGTFMFTRPSRRNPDVMVTTECYRSKYSISWFSPKRGMYKNYKFNIIEC